MLGCPIRKPSDVTLVCSSPKLIAAYRVLLRLSDPRHPPYALNRFKKFTGRCATHTCSLFPFLYSSYYYISHVCVFPICQRTCTDYGWWIMNYKSTPIWHFVMLEARAVRAAWYGTSKIKYLWKNFCKRNMWYPSFPYGGGYRSRTDDPLRARQML